MKTNTYSLLWHEYLGFKKKEKRDGSQHSSKQSLPQRNEPMETEAEKSRAQRAVDYLRSWKLSWNISLCCDNQIEWEKVLCAFKDRWEKTKTAIGTGNTICDFWVTNLLPAFPTCCSQSHHHPPSHTDFFVANNQPVKNVFISIPFLNFCAHPK